MSEAVQIDQGQQQDCQEQDEGQAGDNLICRRSSYFHYGVDPPDEKEQRKMFAFAMETALAFEFNQFAGDDRPIPKRIEVELYNLRLDWQVRIYFYSE